MLAFSSDIYLIKTAELQKLPHKKGDNTRQRWNHTLSGRWKRRFPDKRGRGCCRGGGWVSAGTSGLSVISEIKKLFINLNKKIKRRHYIISPAVYTVPLQCLYDNHVLRGERNAQNAYEWTNKRWQMSAEEKHKRWTDLYNSLKNRGLIRNDPDSAGFEPLSGGERPDFSGAPSFGDM